MTAQWKNRSTKRGGESRLKFGDAEVVVHRHIDYEPDVWLCTCHELRVDCVQVGRGDADAMPAAKDNAVHVVRTKLSALLKALGKASP